MASQISLCLLFVLFFTGLMGWSEAYQFNVGGKDGWVLNPSENYNHWAGRMRFQVNDTLFFKYKKGSDSVLVVSKEDYDKCNTQKPIMKMEDGDSVFKFDRSGPFYFITGNNGNCDNGQKLIVVVLAVRNKPNSPPPSPAAGAPAPLVQTPAPSPIPSTPSPSPVAEPPATSPTPTSNVPVPSPTPSPTPILSPSPAITPVSPTPAESPAPMSTSPTASTPSTTPTTPSPSTPTLSPPSSNNAPAPGGTPANIAPPPSSSPAFTPSAVVFMSSITLALSVYIF